MNKKEWEDWKSFVDSTVQDSPHCGDDETMDWFWDMLEKVNEIVTGHLTVESEVEQEENHHLDNLD